MFVLTVGSGFSSKPLCSVFLLLICDSQCAVHFCLLASFKILYKYFTIALPDSRYVFCSFFNFATAVALKPFFIIVVKLRARFY